MGGDAITINPRYAFWLSPFMFKGDERPGLDGIIIQPWKKGCLLVATDGHVLGLVYDDKATASKALVWKPTEDLIKIGRFAERHDQYEQVTLTSLYGERIGKPAFNVRKFLKTVKRPATPRLLRFNPDLMTRFKNVCGGRGAVMQPTGDKDAAIVTSGYRPEFFGLIMPMAVPDAPAWPAWLGKAPQ